MTGLASHLDSLLATDGVAVIVTVASVRGSAPREAGARMIVGRDGRFAGTIGGGTLEWQALAEAQKLLVSPDAPTLRRLTRALGPDLGQCCGGHVTLTLERVTAADGRRVAGLAEAEAATPLWLFGAGHVGRALALALAPLPFAVTWIDPRPDAFPPVVPANVRCIRGDDPAGLLSDAPDGALVYIMTHSHPLDLAIATAALAARRFARVGVIGSATKRARFLSRMRAAGLHPALTESLVCPIGVPGVVGKEPAVIAAAVAAEALMHRVAAPVSAQSGEAAHVRS